MMTMFYIKRRNRYDYSLKSTDERSEFIDKKLGFIWDVTPDLLMGYSKNGREQNSKFNRIPKMIDAYTTYFLSSRDAGSKSKTEYSFYLDERDERRRKSNRAINGMDLSMDDDHKHYEYTGKTPSFLANEKIMENSLSAGLGESSLGGINSDIIKYAISNGGLDRDGYKKVLSHSGDILCETKDSELIEMIEQTVFNCMVSAKDDLDIDILKMYVNGEVLRGISEKLGTGKSTVDRRLNSMLSWAGQE